MSVWAKTWAYEQRCGKVRTEGRYEGRYKGNPGAKAVLVAIAEFANEEGVCLAGQETIAEMCDMEERTVREHMAYLEDELELIVRSERRRRDGSRTSDETRLLAPASRLGPPRKSRDKQPENLAGRESPTGKETQANRKTTATSPENFSGPYIEEPSVEPSGEPRETRSRNHRPENVDYEREIDEALDDDQLAAQVRQLMDLRALENKTGEMSFGKLWREIVEPYTRLRASPEFRKGRGSLEAALNQAIAAEKPNMNWVKKAALGGVRSTPGGLANRRARSTSRASSGVRTVVGDDGNVRGVIDRNGDEEFFD